MEYIVPNGFKFTSKDEWSSIDAFIASGMTNRITIALPNDIFVEFEGDKYIDSFELPF